MKIERERIRERKRTEYLLSKSPKIDNKTLNHPQNIKNHLSLKKEREKAEKFHLYMFLFLLHVSFLSFNKYTYNADCFLSLLLHYLL